MVSTLPGGLGWFCILGATGWFIDIHLAQDLLGRSIRHAFGYSWFYTRDSAESPHVYIL